VGSLLCMEYITAFHVSVSISEKGFAKLYPNIR